MKRISVVPRSDKDTKLESIGFSFHKWDDYWNENVAYQFNDQQIDVLEQATNDLHAMCIQAVEHVIANDRFSELGIPEAFWQPITKSFLRSDTSIYGRFDLAYDGVNPPKMLEYNADTPTSLLESAVAQWYWSRDVKPDDDQFNSLHERLVDRWKTIDPSIKKVHFASLIDNEEDWVCVHYMMETAVQAGLQVEHLYMNEIGYDSVINSFVDTKGAGIQALFKLYPWEWMMREEFGQYVSSSETLFIEPIWKSLLSNKGILPILWEMYPDHPNLLPAYFDSTKLTSYAKKPFFSREGANIELMKDGSIIAKDDGPYGDEGYIYQQLVDLKSFDGHYPIIGSWIVGDESAGMCVREDSLQITTNMSKFVPHFFTET